MIVDSLAFVGESIAGPSATAADAISLMDAVGVDRSLICAAKPRGYHLGPANELVADAVRDCPDRLTGLARVDPLQGDEACAELERGLGELGLRGLFLHPWEETFRITDPRVEPLVEIAGRHGVPVVVAGGYPWLSEALQVAAVAGRFPATTFVATNGLQLNISGLGQTDAELALAAADNLLVQTAGVYREDFLEGVVRRFGERRVLYASSFPLLDPRLEIRRVQWAAFSDEQASAMLGGNARAVFGLSVADEAAVDQQ